MSRGRESAYMWRVTVRVSRQTDGFDSTWERGKVREGDERVPGGNLSIFGG